MEPGLYQGPKQTEVHSQLDVARIPIGRYHRAKCWIGLWMYPRFIERRIREALADTPAVILNGPRQSGKTTLARRLAGPDWTYLTLDDATLLNAARSDPVGFVRGLDRAVIDEVQLAPDLLPAVKRSIDEDRRPGQFLLTGSANILTIPRVKELLAGRMEILPLYPLSRGEVLGSKPPRFLASAFAGRAPPPPHETLVGEDLVATVLAGGYPEVLARSSERRRRDWCRSYVDAIVERDIREIADVEKLGQMPRLIEVLAQLTSQLLNLSEIGGQLGFDHKTADRYIAILEQLFLVRRLRPWFRNELKRLVKTPKLHVMDTGLLAAMRGLTLDRLRVNRGALGPVLESYVHAELVKEASWADERVSFFHYRDKDQVEVDFVIENEAGDVVGIEVKAAATVVAPDFRGLERLRNATDDAFALGVVLYDGDQIVPFGRRLFAAPFSSLWN